jgi:DDE superfamily endonuclease
VPSVWRDSRTSHARGARAVFPPEQVVEVKAIACELPVVHGLPLSRFSRTELHRLVIERGLTEASASTIWRWLHEDAIRPWQVRSWILRRDPEFLVKASRALDLYQRRFEGKRLAHEEYVISADEKSQLQALGRRHPTTPPGPGRPLRCEFEYHRGGTLAYLAAWDVHHAKIFGRVEEKTGIEPFGRLVEEVMTSEPYASAKRVFWVVDNGSSHAGRASIERLEGAYKNLRLIHLPVPRLLAEPDRALLLDRAAQGAHPQRPRLPEGARRAIARLPGTLRADRPALRVDIHPGRPGRG